MGCREMITYVFCCYLFPCLTDLRVNLPRTHLPSSTPYKSAWEDAEIHVQLWAILTQDFSDIIFLQSSGESVFPIYKTRMNFLINEIVGNSSEIQTCLGIAWVSETWVHISQSNLCPYSEYAFFIINRLKKKLRA